jgi:hypothetical protein
MVLVTALRVVTVCACVKLTSFAVCLSVGLGRARCTHGQRPKPFHVRRERPTKVKRETVEPHQSTRSEDAEWRQIRCKP